MNRLNPVAIGLSLAITVGLLFVLCALAVAIAPGALVVGLTLVTHGLNLTPLTRQVAPLTLSSVLVGLLAVMAVSFVTGLLFALVSNLLTKSRNG
jgi:hypothetical protein